MSTEKAEWFVVRTEWKSDALTSQTLRGLIERGVLARDDLIWRAGWGNWVAVDDAVAAFPQLLESARPQPEPENDNTEADARHSTMKSRIYHELVSYSAIAGYLWFVLFMLWLHEIVILERHGIADKGHEALIANALILGKVILIAEVLRLGMKMKFSRPIISIVIRSLLFAIALVCFHILEHAVLALWHGEPVLPTITDMSTLQQDIVIVAIMTVALMPYHTFKVIQELVPDIRILGHVLGFGSHRRQSPE